MVCLFLKDNKFESVFFFFSTLRQKQHRQNTVEVQIPNLSIFLVVHPHTWTLRGVPIVPMWKGKVGGKLGL